MSGFSSIVIRHSDQPEERHAPYFIVNRDTGRTIIRGLETKGQAEELRTFVIRCKRSFAAKRAALVFSKSKITIGHSRLPADVHAPYSLVDQTGRVLVAGIETESDAMEIAKDVDTLAVRRDEGENR